MAGHHIKYIPLSIKIKVCQKKKEKERKNVFTEGWKINLVTLWRKAGKPSGLRDARCTIETSADDAIIILDDRNSI